MNNIDMQSVSVEEMEFADGGGSAAGALLIGEGTLIACVAGGGWAFGPWGISACGVAGLLAAGGSLYL